MESTFVGIDHRAPGAGQIQVNMSPDAIVKAIQELTDAVKALKPEVRIDLPAMNPTIEVHPARVEVVPGVPPIVDVHPADIHMAPVTVTVPDFPPQAAALAPIVNVTVPDFPTYEWVPYPPRYAALFLGGFVVAQTAAQIFVTWGLPWLVRTFG